MRSTYRATIAYDGAPFAGYAAQRGSRTVESTLVDALRPLIPELPAIKCGGRTDRGVHATGQVISFWSRSRVSLDALARAIDTAAPDAIALRHICEAPRSFHATFAAKSRHYVYLYEGDGDIRRLDALLDALCGTRCFSAFARNTPRGASTVRRLYQARALSAGPGRIRFDFRASGFLKRQVRVMVATALAQQHQPSDTLVRMAESGERSLTASPVPSAGLHLAEVAY